MKKRKSPIVICTLAALALVAAVVMYFIGFHVLKVGIDLVQFIDYIVPAITKFQDMLISIPVIAVAAIWLVLSVIWIVIDAKRKKGIVALFVILFLLSTALLALYYPYYYAATAKFTKFVIYELIIAGLIEVSFDLFIVLFIVDMVTGRNRLPAPAAKVEAPIEEEEEVKPVFEEIKDEEEVAAEEAEAEAEEEKVEEEKAEENVEDMATEPKERKPRKPAAKKATEAPKEEKAPRSTQSILLTNEDGQVYAKAYHVSRRPELNKWQVKATGSKKVLKLFNTQKEAIDYAEGLAKSTGASVRVHSKAGKIRKHK